MSRPRLVVGVPDVEQRADRVAEVPRRLVLRPLAEDVALLVVVADDLDRVAVARFQVLVRVQPQPDGDGAAPALGVVAEHLVVLERRAGGPLLGEVQRPAEPPRVGRQLHLLVRLGRDQLLALLDVARLVAAAEVRVEPLVERRVQGERLRELRHRFRLRLARRGRAGLRLQPDGVHGDHAVGVLLAGLRLRVGELHRHERLRGRVAVLQVLEDRPAERVLALLGHGRRGTGRRAR